MSDSLCASTAYRAMTRLFVIATAWLCLLLPHVAQAEDDFLPPEKAFRLDRKSVV